MHTPSQSNFFFECDFCPETPKHVGVCDDADVECTDEETDEPMPECHPKMWNYDLARPTPGSLRLELQQTKPSRNSARPQAAMHVCWLHVHAFCWCVHAITRDCRKCEQNKVYWKHGLCTNPKCDSSYVVVEHCSMLSENLSKEIAASPPPVLTTNLCVYALGE